jgi:nicotinate phosphoribosyltransferase
VVDYLQDFHYSASDLAYLETLQDACGEPYFSREFLDYLGKMKFSCSVDAVPEGTVVFPYEPLLRIQGPLIQCQLMESPFLNLINFSTLIATKASRVCLAAKGDPVIEFGMRRAQGIDGALTASRSAFIGGCQATSNVLAGKLYGIPVKGTHAHSWIMAFDDELESFKTYAKAMANNCVFLVDTYDTIEGVKKAIIVGKWLKKQGRQMLGVRLDSGDLTDLSIRSRKLLDEAGLSEAKILASNELDETLISELKRQGAQIGVWGVGTNLVTAKDQPALDGVYKISALRDPGGRWQYKLKLSEQMVKVSNPGIHQVRRFYDESGNIADMIYDLELGIGAENAIVDPFDATKQRSLKSFKSVDLLQPIFREGRQVYQLPPLKEIQAATHTHLEQFQVGIKRFINPHVYVVGMEKTLYDLKVELIRSIRAKTQAASHG